MFIKITRLLPEGKKTIAVINTANISYAQPTMGTLDLELDGIYIKLISGDELVVDVAEFAQLYQERLSKEG
jgi:hypothetical protein